MIDQSIVFADHSWETRAGGKMLVYFGPHLKHNLDHDAVRQMIRARKAWGAVWNYDWDGGSDCPWYSYVCDTPGYELDKLQSKNSRKTIRRALERCDVRTITPAWLADHGYDTHAKATARYKDYKLVSRAEFAREMRSLEAGPGVRMYGVFVDDALVAYGIAREFAETVRFSIAEFDPDFAHAKPMYALYYTLAHECLNAEFKDIDAGWRPFVHDTNIEEFFRRMGWRQAPCRLDLFLTRPLRLITGAARTFRKPLQKLLPSRQWIMVEGLLVAQRVARQSTMT